MQHPGALWSGYSHPSFWERHQIARLCAGGQSKNAIAGALGRATSTIKRELERNSNKVARTIQQAPIAVIWRAVSVWLFWFNAQILPSSSQSASTRTGRRNRSQAGLRPAMRKAFDISAMRPSMPGSMHALSAWRNCGGCCLAIKANAASGRSANHAVNHAISSRTGAQFISAQTRSMTGRKAATGKAIS